MASGTVKEEGKGWWLGFKAEKENVLQSPLSFLLSELQGKKKKGGGIFSSPLLTLLSSYVTYILQTNKIDRSHSCTSAWPRLAHFTTAIPSSISPYCFQTMPKGLKAGERSPPQEWGSLSGETADFSGHLWRYRTLPSNDSKLDLCLDPARFNNISYLVHRASLRTDF